MKLKFSNTNRNLLAAFLFFCISLFPRVVLPSVCCATQNSIVTTFAGNGGSASGDGGPASSAGVGGPIGLYLDPAGNMLISDANSGQIRKVSPAGIISTIAGTGTPGFSGDGGPALLAQLNTPCQMTEDPAGNLYICDYANHRIRKIDTAGIITTFAGNGTPGSSGDGGPATLASLTTPFGIVVDSSGNVIYSGFGENEIRQISPAGIITGIAGNGVSGHSGDGGPATIGQIALPEALFQDGAGNLYFHEDGAQSFIRKINTACGVISTFAGNGASSSSGDGGPATMGSVGDVHGFAMCGGTLYMADGSTGEIRTVDSCGILGTLTGNSGGPADGSIVSAVVFSNPYAMVVDPAGNLYVASWTAGKVWKISADCSAPSPVCMTPTPACVLSPTATPTITPSPTPTSTPTLSPTPTITNTPTITSTPTNTPTITPTYTPTCVTYVWPNPFNPFFAMNQSLKFSCLPPNAKVSIYTLAGELAGQAEVAGDFGQWKGFNQKGVPAAPGVYYYVVEGDNKVWAKGKILITR